MRGLLAGPPAHAAPPAADQSALPGFAGPVTIGETHVSAMWVKWVQVERSHLSLRRLHLLRLPQNPIDAHWIDWLPVLTCRVGHPEQKVPVGTGVELGADRPAYFEGDGVDGAFYRRIVPLPGHTPGHAGSCFATAAPHG